MHTCLYLLTLLWLHCYKLGVYKFYTVNPIKCIAAWTSRYIHANVYLLCSPAAYHSTSATYCRNLIARQPQKQRGMLQLRIVQHVAIWLISYELQLYVCMNMLVMSACYTPPQLILQLSKYLCCCLFIYFVSALHPLILLRHICCCCCLLWLAR